MPHMTNREKTEIPESAGVPPGCFRTILEEPYFSLYYEDGLYLAEAGLGFIEGQDAQEQWLADFLERVEKEHGLTAWATGPADDSRWIIIEFRQIEVS